MMRHHVFLRRVAAVAVAAALTLTVTSVLAAIKTNVEHDPAVDFTTFRTWTWHPDRPGNAVKIISKEDDSAAFKAQIEPRLLPIVEEEFAKRGFPMVKGYAPDFYVTYYVMVTAGSSSQYIGQFMSTPEWGLPPFAAQTQSLEYFPQGSLVLDLTSRSTNAVVWRGLAQAELNWDEPVAKKDQRVREAVRELLKKFPPKPTKARP
jgi:hypothetical protein